MDILMGLVIAMFIITAAYVGFHASQEPPEDAGGHSITTELEILNNNANSSQLLVDPNTIKPAIF